MFAEKQRKIGRIFTGACSRQFQISRRVFMVLLKTHQNSPDITPAHPTPIRPANSLR